jgi:hypothetical protein
MGADDETPQGGMEMTGEAPMEVLPGLYDVNPPSKPPTKNRGGRPRKTIDYEHARELARKMGTYDEIAIELGVSRTWLERDRKFREVYLVSRADGVELNRTRVSLIRISSHPTCHQNSSCIPPRYKAGSVYIHRPPI